MGPIETGFYQVTRDQFQNKEQQKNKHRELPPIEDGKGKQKRQQSRRDRTDVRNDAKQCGDGAPKNCVRHSDQVQSEAAEDSKTRIHQKLEQKVSAHPVRSVLHGLGHQIEAAQSCEPDYAITNVSGFHEKKNREYKDD